MSSYRKFTFAISSLDEFLVLHKGTVALPDLVARECKAGHGVDFSPGAAAARWILWIMQYWSKWLWVVDICTSCPCRLQLSNLNWVRYNISPTPNTLVISGTGFMGQLSWSDPINSVKGSKHWKKIMPLGLGFNPIRSTPPVYNTTTHMQYKTSKHKVYRPKTN